MRFLHTADWHVGRTIRGRSRAGEHEAVLAEIAAIAAEREVDAVLVCGDLFDTAAPSPESERIVYEALLALAATGARVVVIAGNHDSDRRLAAVQPLLELAHVATRPTFVDADTALVEVPSRDGGETMRVATIPFLSQRWIVRATALMEKEAAEAVQVYERRYRQLVGAVTAGFGAGTVNVVAAHAFVHGAEVTGSERAAHLATAYGISSTAFSGATHYVALGHLHRPQAVPGPCPVRYSGSPLQLDFGEAGQAKSVVVVEASPGTPARVEEVPLIAGARLRVVRGSLAELEALAPDPAELLRVHVREKLRVGLADDVRELLPGAVDVILEGGSAKAAGSATGAGVADGRGPADLFAAYLADSGVGDPRLEALFAELLEEATAP